MKVYLGNTQPRDGVIPTLQVPAPTVTVCEIKDHLNDDGTYASDYIIGSDAAGIKDHLFDNPGLVTHLPGNGAIIQVTRSWPDHSDARPSWVAVEAGERDPAEAEDFERFLSEFWKCPRGVPADLEDTHYTSNGPPGVGPAEGE